MIVSKFKGGWLLIFAILAFLIGGSGCVGDKSKQSEYCTLADFKKLDKIDAHCHVNSKRPEFLNIAEEYNFRIVAINTDAYSYVTVEEQQEIANFQQKAFPDRLYYISTFSMKGWEKDDWLEKTLAYLKESVNKGAIGFKVWKNIGMDANNKKDGEFIMIDDPMFDPIFNYLEENNIPLCGHLGEPKNCWLPLEEMTAISDREYFESHPEYHMYLHPEFPSYEKQIAARDNLLQKHPKLIFMGAHLGSLEWSTDELAKHFDKFPNSTADMAERICHLQLQTQSDYEKVRNFFITYQDRLMYGTDRGDRLEPDTKVIKERALEAWTKDWQYFTTDDTMTAREFDGEFKGLKLPRSVIEKIYYKNAERTFSINK